METFELVTLLIVLSLAMALSIPNLPVKEPIVFITYSIVLFSIIVQGLTIEWVASRNTSD